MPSTLSPKNPRRLSRALALSGAESEIAIERHNDTSVYYFKYAPFRNRLFIFEKLPRPAGKILTIIIKMLIDSTTVRSNNDKP